MNIQQIAEQLLNAEKTSQPIAPLTDFFPEISVDEAYAIQLQQVQEKVEKGAVIVGKKSA